ncbi:hypothetical protein ACWD7F_10660 [Streptomyces sp. NPDC005122]
MSGDIAGNLPGKLERVPFSEIQEGSKVNGEAAVRCNALEIEFLKSEFDRGVPENVPGALMATDPPIPLAVNLANNWLTRLRVLSRASQIKPLDITKSIWRLRYLCDDGQLVERSEGKIRELVSAAFTFNAVAMNAELWGAVDALPWGYEPVATDTLLLDAAGAVEDVGPAIVLAFTALETRIGYALDLLSRMNGVSPKVWDWIQDRSDYRKEPSITEKFDSLLRVLTRHSLKQEGKLWEGFQNLRAARNSFAHNGQAIVGKKPVDWQEASRLVALAREIVDWIDGLLPAAERRPKFDTESVKMESSFMIMVPEALKETRDGSTISARDVGSQE